MAVGHAYVFASHGRGRTQRQSYYFWGKPGVGKTATAHAFARLLNLPLRELSLRTEDDLTSDALEGTPVSRMDSKRGLFVDCLSTPNPEGVTSLNGIVLINEFDRMFLAKGFRADTALGLLLDLLDPNKKTVRSPYFGDAEIDISRLVVILTGNGEIADDGDKRSPLHALRDRLDRHIIEFPDPHYEMRQSILENQFEALCTEYNIQDDMRSSDDFRRVLVEHAARHDSSIRACEGEFERVLRKAKSMQVDGENLDDIIGHFKRPDPEPTPTFMEWLSGYLEENEPLHL